MKQNIGPTYFGKLLFVTSFDLWISNGAYDNFALVIYFLGVDW
jgi:hypothetical protein